MGWPLADSDDSGRHSTVLEPEKLMAKKERRIVQLPRGYISYSQLQLWLNDEERYKKLYFEERDDLRTSNSGQEYGKVVATLLETGGSHDDAVTDTAMFLLPKYDVADKEITAVLETKEGDIKIVGRPDSMDSKSKDFYEYKTGKHPWTQSKAQNHLQMRFYAMTIYLAYGVSLKEAALVWIETEQGPDGIRPTGRIETFPVTFTMQMILETMAMTAKAAKEIEVAYAQFTPDPRITTF
jgi:hypothetical protein